MPKYKVLSEGFYGDQDTFFDVVEADNEIFAVLYLNGGEYSFDEECFDDDGNPTDKFPKTFEELQEMSLSNDRILTVEEI
jgi:hypothetical protein